jgi:phosphonate transport system ATP-binding protein
MNFVLRGVSVRHLSGHGKSAALQTAALSDINISIMPGEQIALIGPSGAGKTTLLHTLACALRPDSGDLTAFGVFPWKMSSTDRQRLRSRLFLAPQTPPLPPRQRVVNAVLAGRLPYLSNWQSMLSLLKPSDPKAAFYALREFNLQDKLYARVDRLSGGERQRCGIARLLVSRAEAFLVDEPLSALDPTLALQTLEVLRREAAGRNSTLICSLHQVELARTYFPRLIGLRGGRIVFDDSRENITDAMIADLYRNAHRDALMDEAPAVDETDDAESTKALPPISRCF